MITRNMVVKLMKKMPIGMYEKIGAIPDEPKVDQERFTRLMNECRSEYPDYFDRLITATHPIGPPQQTKELEPITIAAIGLAAGYGMAMGRKIYNDHYSGKGKKGKEKKEEMVAEAMPSYTIWDPDETVPDPIKDILDRTTREALPRFESAMRPSDPLELAAPIIDKLLPPIWDQPDWVIPLFGPIKLAQAEVASAEEQEIASAVILVGSVVVGAAIADGQVGKVIDAARDYFCKKGKKG